MSSDDRSLSRRGFLAGLGSTAAGFAVAPALTGETLLGRADAQPAVDATAHPRAAPFDLKDVQGNILAGFNKDHAAFVGLQFTSGAGARAWLAALAPQIATDAEVSAFNAAFKQVATRTGSKTPLAVSATWLNVAFTASGLNAIGATLGELGQFPNEFRAGMGGRASVLGDVGTSAPVHWPAPFRARSHALVTIGADQASARDAAIAQQQQLAAKHGVKVLWVQKGDVRGDQPGFEHFGYRDGISQPGIRGYTPVSNPTDPNHGQPGQDLVFPGEFLLGQPAQAGAGKPTNVPGPNAPGGPPWAKNGSFLVFRRLRQDVAGWRDFVVSTAQTANIPNALAAAKLVGRWESGAPLEITGDVSKDPGFANPALLSPANVNNFKYSTDVDGIVVPLAAHIRKTNPRNGATDTGNFADTLRRRILRRGIPFGTTLPLGTPTSDPSANPPYPNDRGLCFVCYQSSISRQFEFMQNHWANNPNFPKPGAGQDPISAQTTLPGSFSVPGGRQTHIELMARFVVTSGGDYYFAPSISALHVLATKP